MNRLITLFSCLVLSYQSMAFARLNDLDNVPGDSSVVVNRRFMASIQRLHHTDVLSLFPRLLEVCPAVAFSIPCIPPVGAWEHNRLSSKFGWRVHPIKGRYKHHEGIDIAGPHQWVRSTASGRV